jgi:antitoxin ParD1/3/4
MVSLNVSLPVELENRVREHVASGLYGSASEVISEALRLFEAYQATQAGHLQALRSDIHQGLADVRSNRVSTLDVQALKQEGRKRLKQAAK